MVAAVPSLQRIVAVVPTVTLEFLEHDIVARVERACERSDTVFVDVRRRVVVEHGVAEIGRVAQATRLDGLSRPLGRLQRDYQFAHGGVCEPDDAQVDVSGRT